jgi:hypothetical protein
MKTWMNLIARDLWVAALRSGKYKQGTNTLVRTLDPCLGVGPMDEGTCEFCALGVLCEVYCDEVEDIRNRKNTFLWSYGRFENKKFPPLEVLEWAGMTTVFSDHVARVNDDYGVKFDEIALIVEHATK